MYTGQARQDKTRQDKTRQDKTRQASRPQINQSINTKNPSIPYLGCMQDKHECRSSWFGSTVLNCHNYLHGSKMTIILYH